MSYPETVGLDLFTAPFRHSQASMASGRKSAQTARPHQAQAPAAQPESSIYPAHRPDTAASMGQIHRPEIPEKSCPDKKGPDPAQSQPQKGQPDTSEPTPKREAQAETPDPTEKQSPAAVPPQPEPPKKELTMDMTDSTIPAGKPLAASDAVKRKAHEEFEAKRREEWEAKQRKRKEKEEAALKKIQSMSDADAVAASTKCVRRAIERITRRNMKECVAEHVQELCRNDPGFARCVMYPRKSMTNCFRYINRKAKEYLKNEMEENGIGAEDGVYGGDVPDEICYQWAKEYFRDPDALEDREKEDKFISKPYAGRSAVKKKTTKAKDTSKKGRAKKSKTDEDYNQMSLEGIG